MKKRFIYPLGIIVALLIIHFAVQPLLHHFVLSSRLTEIEFRIYYLSINLLVTIALTIILFIRGKYIRGVRTIAELMCLIAILDVVRLVVYPDVAVKSNVVTFFAGIFVFSFSLVSIKMATFKKGAGLFFVLIGAVYMLRFPIFVDIFYYNFKKYLIPMDAAEKYFQVTVYANYILVLLGLFALNTILLENKAWSR